MKWIRRITLLAVARAAAAAAQDSPLPPDGAAALRSRAAALFGTVLPAAEAEIAAPQAQLGRALFWDQRLSLDGRTACASCHLREAWSSDGRAFSINARGQPTTLHSQPMFMAQDQASLRWYGDRKDGAQQAERSITGSMGLASAKEMPALLRQAGYEAAFAHAFPGEADAVSPLNYARALASYQKTLRTPAPFDRFLAGDHAALPARAQVGLATFLRVGCAGCHNGPLLGGNSLQKFGVVKDYWVATRSAQIDLGRYTATKKDEDRYVYRVPMLRNVEKTAPYFHDGSVASLEQAARVMADVQLGRVLTDAEVGDLVAFLASLTGALPDHYAPPAAARSATQAAAR